MTVFNVAINKMLKRQFVVFQVEVFVLTTLKQVISFTFICVLINKFRSDCLQVFLCFLTFLKLLSD